MAYLITCSGSKLIPQEEGDSEPSRLDLMSYHKKLGGLREKLICSLNIRLDWKHTLPAWRLYSGPHSQLYRRVDQDKLNRPSTSIKILSALFGWISHTDQIPWYNLKMSDNVGALKMTVCQYWYNSNVLMPIVDRNVDVDLLSGNYRKALVRQPGIKAVGNDPGVRFKGYGAQKGVWLSSQL